jgi:hypothetical protein
MAGMARLLVLLAVLILAGACTGCLETIAEVVMAPEVVAGQAAASTASAAATGLNEMTSDANTLGDLDRILSGMPPDSPQRGDLTRLREELGSHRSVRAVNGDQHRFASDPKAGMDYDRRVADAADRADERSPSHQFQIPDRAEQGHQLMIDPPRVVGSDAAGPRDPVMPFHTARTSDLETWHPRWYGPSFPSLPQAPDHRGLDD